MPKNFIYVEKHNGYYIPFEQNALKTQFEKTHDKVFDGACVGVVAAVLELFLVSLKKNHQFFSPASKDPFALSASRCIHLQEAYEQNIEGFFTAFIRERLKINVTGFADYEGYAENPQEILRTLSRGEATKNQIVLMKALYKLESTDASYNQEHKLCILKLDNQYIFCEPNYGIALFNTLDDVKKWLDAEMSHGALRYYQEPVHQKMIIYNNKTTDKGEKEGVLTVYSVFFESFSFPIKNVSQPELSARIQSRL